MENNEVTVIAGKCGEDVAFSFDGSVLRISGSGAMYNYTDPACTPFADFRSKVSELVIEDDIGSIGNCAINSERDFRKTQQKISNNIENSLQMIA